MANAVMSASMSVGSDSRSDVRSEAMRLMRRVLTTLVAIVCLIVLVTQKEKLLAMVDHPIEKLQVSGAFGNLQEKHVNQALADVVGTGFFTVDLDDVKHRVEALPWVSSATVSRVWPGQITLFLTEQEAVSVWNGAALLNPHGEVFKPQHIPQELAALPVLYGSEKFSEAKRRSMFDMFQLLQAKLVTYGQSLVSVELNARNAWEMTLSNGVSVALGAMDHSTHEGVEKLSSKVDRVGKVFTARANIDLALVERIDARYPNGVAIKWRNTDKLIAKKGSR